MTKEIFFDLTYPEPNTGCWLWAGSSSKTGHGRFSCTVNGQKGQLAHRYSFFIHNGEFDNNLCVLHKCDNPHCVNPDHLYLGDQRQNNLDRDTRGRQKTKRGCEHKLSRFSEEIIREIRAKHNPAEFPSRRLAKIYSCSQKAIMNIINHKSYKNVL